MAHNLPFSVKRSGGQEDCSRCNQNIQNETLQLAVMVQSVKKDAKEPKWYCFECFFKDARPSSDIQIANFGKLDNTSQRLIQKQIAKASDNASGNKGVKRAASNSQEQLSSLHSAIDDFAVNYARSAQHVCKYCFRVIAIKAIEVKKIIREIDATDANTIWYHVGCFKQNAHKLGWYEEDLTELPGFKSLKTKDQQALKPDAESNDENNNEPPSKKRKSGSLDDVNEIIERKIKKQNSELHDLRDLLKRDFTQRELIEILTTNKQFVPEDKEEILMHTADVIYFGALESCAVCKNGKFIFGNSSYDCIGNLSHFAKCNNTVKEPKRSVAKLPPRIQDADKTYLKKEKLNVKIRATKIIQPNVLVNISKPLFDMEFGITGCLQKTHTEIKTAIQKMGGRVTPYFMDKKTAAVISKVEEVRKHEQYMKPLIKQAKQLGLQVVPVSFIDRVKTADPFDLIKEMNLSPWNCIDPIKRVPRNGVLVSKTDSFYDDKEPKVLRLTNGTPVDAECNLKDVHVCLGYVERYVYKPYAATMTLVDIASNKNSYCRIQLLESYDRKSYYTFEKEGRISTKIATNTQKEYKTKDEAVSAFEARYMELTGNAFEIGFDAFKKQPEKYQLIEIAYDDHDIVLDHLIESRLNPLVYKLMKLICDEDSMKETMLSYNLDTDLVPMGKISKRQIDVAQKVLEELSTLVQNKASESKFIEASSRFYTMIPHKFIQKRPTIINKAEMVRSKFEMLQSLREINFTYSLLNEIDGTKNPLDNVYRKMNTDIIPLDRKSKEYEQIVTYTQQTSDTYTVKVQDIFEVVCREDENRFKPLYNHTLLWHGSSLSNFVSIFSQGLKLSQGGGGCFGRGIYFADAFARSAPFSGDMDEEIVLLLCEVALGDVHELNQPDRGLEIAPNGKHSVKGCGKAYPPSHFVRNDGVRVPYGNLEIDEKIISELGLNEYIVYDEAQVKIRYLVKVKFVYDHYLDCSCSECATDDEMTDSDIGSGSANNNGNGDVVVISDDDDDDVTVAIETIEID